MVAHLSQEWLDRYRELCVDLPSEPGASAVVEHLVPKTPDGDVAYVLRWEDGRLVEARLGKAEDVPADELLTLTITHPDAEAMARGELDVPTGFMQGRVKLVGPMARFLPLQAVLQHEEHRDALRQLASETKL